MSGNVPAKSRDAAHSANRLPGLDGLRGCACLLVFLYHLRWHTRPSDESPVQLQLGSVDFEPILTRCNIGVTIFFVLSGLLLSLPFWRAISGQRPAPEFSRYLWRRACRIIPAYYSVLIVVYLLREGTYTPVGFTDFLLHVTFLHNFADQSYFSFLGVLWTIGIEFQFYLLLPLIMAGVGALHRKIGLTGSVTALIAITWILDFGAAALLRSLAPLVDNRILADTESAVVDGTIFSYLKVFAFGIAAAGATLQRQLKPRLADGLCFAALAAILLILVTGHEEGWHRPGFTAWPFNTLAIAVLACCLPQSALLSRALDTRLLASTGTISYGIYLWHEPVMRAVCNGSLRHHLSGWLLFTTAGLVSLAVTVLIAALSWHRLEKPALRARFPLPQ